MLNQVLPQIECEASSRQYGRFVIGPLESGYGITLGNALRRVLLSSLVGGAITSIRVSGVPHEFSTVPYVKEDMTSLILNIKQLRFRFNTELEDSFHVQLEVKGEGEITGADLQVPSQIELINPEQHLLTADSNDVDLDIEMVVGRGRGYSPAEERGRLPIGEIPVDAIFSPIRKANFQVTKMRVAQKTNYDRLAMEIWTDGSIGPQESLSQAARMLVEHISRIAGLGEVCITPSERQIEEEGIPSRIADTPIEELDLSVRAYNCLKRAGIMRVGEILTMLEQGEDEIMSIRNFGRKSLNELLERLEAKGFLDAIDYRPSATRDGDGLDEEEEEDFEEEQER